MNIDVKITKLHKDAIIPTYSHNDDACCDLYTLEGIVLNPGDRALMRTGVAVEIPTGWEIQVRPRSGLALRHGLSIVNAPGTVDAQYRNELKILLINLGTIPVAIEKNDRIAQMCLKPVYKMNFIEVDVLSNSQRGLGGWGSTGK